MAKEKTLKFQKQIIFYTAVLLPLILCLSCLHSRTGSYSAPKNVSLKIKSGSAILTIYGQINENLYYGSITDNNRKDNGPYEKLSIAEGTITKNEEKYLTTGEEYSFSLQPTESVTINIRSLNNNDIEILVYENGRERIYAVKGTDVLGRTLGFQNR